MKTLRNIFILAAMMFAAVGCTKEVMPETNDPETQEIEQPYIISVPIEIGWFGNDSISISLEHIRFYKNEIIVEDRVTVYHTFHQIGSAPHTTEYKTWYEFKINKEYLSYEISYLKSLKDNEGFFSVIENAYAKKWNLNPQVWHGKTECLITDEQIDYVVNQIENNVE